ncbi:PAS domain-containing sensor histidine kinase [Novosphingobium sp. 1949]|uniref:histidine kinase n=1 Tax=Novosphingobium organovorum TaxID=2930092 RepID=A0ABT0BHN0_9SPHN|nr:PAS domain-containing sensor histidine kinase [Novosphingobium organovorum]MCJ2184425.1 PAS domain-containing sensor histidine kinase [Novosphingobium organovorum]
MTVAISYGTQFPAALVHAPIGALLLERSGVILGANPAVAGIFSESEPETLVHSLIYVWLGEKDAETLRQMIEIHFDAPPEARIGWTRRMVLLNNEGSEHPVEITLSPCPDSPADHAVLFVRSLMRVLTAEKRFAQIFETLPVGLLVVDIRQRIVKANRTLAADFGYTREELIGQPLEILLPVRYRGAHAGHVRSYSEAPMSRMMGTGRDLTGLHRSGQEFPIEIALTRHENVSQPLFMAIVSDISYRKRAEVAMQQTNAQLEEFTYVASHDLRSPLRGIADLVSWIREDLSHTELPTDVERNFDRIAVRIERAEQMIDDLLNYARVGVRDPQLETLHPQDLIDEALSLVTVPDSFTIEVEVAAMSLQAARAPLCASLRNLISNAIKHHGSDSGRISIRASEEGRFTVFTVEDDGQGIPPGNEERIFKLFHRGSTRVEGDGVGLAFTRRMINANGGMISVTSPGPMGGARFDVYWPRILLREFDND